ncbi:MAG TPA: hypothetical protein VHY08_17645 [Bacillota bacterium]|nr:hypothetical protein [Bacillota bacterium]
MMIHTKILNHINEVYNDLNELLLRWLNKSNISIENSQENEVFSVNDGIKDSVFNCRSNKPWFWDPGDEKC